MELFNYYMSIFFKVSSLANIYFSVISYIVPVLIIFSIISILDSRNILILNDLKNIGKFSYVSFLLLLSFLSLAGMPPFLPFCTKALIISFFFTKSNFFFLLIFFLINFSSMYFYLQNTRYLISKNSNIKFFFENHLTFINFKLIAILCLLSFLSFFSIFFIETLFFILCKLSLLVFLF